MSCDGDDSEFLEFVAVSDDCLVAGVHCSFKVPDGHVFLFEALSDCSFEFAA